MVIFHFSFDLNNFHIVTLDLKHGDFWRYFRFVIVSMFVFSSGISLQLAYGKQIDIKKLIKRVLILSGAALLVSIGSYTQFPKTWIYFGILHFFLFASVAGLIFLRIPKIALLLGLAIIAGYNFQLINMHWLYWKLQAPLHLPIDYTEDLANVIPWFGVFLLGMSFAKFGLHYKLFDNRFFNSENRMNQSFSFLGRHSLFVYLIHQPILFSIFLLLKMF